MHVGPLKARKRRARFRIFRKDWISGRAAYAFCVRHVMVTNVSAMQRWTWRPRRSVRRWLLGWSDFSREHAV